MTIAVYSGEIPSTTFIERLISGLVEHGQQLILFGIRHGSNHYSNSVTVVGYRHNRFSKALHLLKFTLLLLLFKRDAKRRLDSFLKASDRYTLNDKVKCYPVLWHQPEIFHLQWAKGIADWAWVQEFGMRLVVSLRGAHINYSPVANTNLAEIYHQTFPKVDAFHAVSEAIAREAQKYGAAKDRIQVVYSGLDIPNSERLSKHASNSTVFRLLSVGRSHWKKGYVYALDACAILKENGFKFKYTIIGGSDSIELLYQVRDLDLEDYVDLLGQVPFDTVKAHMTDADLLLLPSVEEGIANVVLEAMSLGTLVLSTDCGGMTEVIVPGVNGFITPVRHVDQMADNILAISKLSESEKAVIRDVAHTTILKNHRTGLMVQNMLQIYKHATKE
ncbi:hypothetical protein C1T31_13405 [Hanstruepera neustonica]|uniref:Colanic acid biosynthesis protein n=1 Tax=Hanstruepera neustonica TaxID=1445657 RepID=A0A2K1DVQ4_9FLAO|nr:glycosyltransferase [Hanstruepera neustonica]PNQ72097.1 hypothetical protein C1T31_13405 [Hanstruepera neustonica]